MKVHIESVRAIKNLRQWLLDGGWQLADDGSTHLTADHPEVIDQLTARARLHELGLLTCGQLRIEFDPSRGVPKYVTTVVSS